jgi:WD40 repeat protein
MKNPVLVILATLALNASAQTLEVSPIIENEFSSRIFYARFLDNKTIAFSGPDSSIRLINLSKLSTNKIDGLKGKPDAFAFSPNRKYMVATSIDNEAKYWDLKLGKVKYSYGEYAPGYVNSKVIRFSPDNSRFAINWNCDFAVWKSADGKAADTIKTPENECANVIAWSKDGKKMYVGGNSHIWIYDIQTNKITATKNIEKISVMNDIEISPDQLQVVVCGREGMLLLNADLSDKFELKGHTGWINDIAFSKDGKFLYSCAGTMFGKDRSIKIWDPATGQCIRTMESHTDNVNCIDFSPDGKFLLSASDDKTIKIWSTKNQSLLCTIVPIITNAELYPVFYTPAGIFYGYDDFFSWATVKLDGKEITSASTSKETKAAIIKAFEQAD